MIHEGSPTGIELVDQLRMETPLTVDLADQLRVEVPLMPEIEDKPQDECGVFGIYAPDEFVGGITYQALLELQHRGQSGAGIVVPGGRRNNGEIILAPIWGHGEVREALAESVKPDFQDGASQLDIMTGAPLAIGHTRYSTAEGDNFKAIQPLLGLESNIAVAHNGHIDDLELVAHKYGISYEDVASDSDLLTRIIDHRAVVHGSLEASLKEVLPLLDGAYCLVITDGERVIAARDPFGFHPLALGELPDNRGLMVASEAVAFNNLGAQFVRDVEPGEVVIMDHNGTTSFMIDRQEPTRHCMFEYIYIARPDGTIDNVPVYRMRKQLGRYLAEDNPDLKADIVVGVPQSGLAAAAGFSEESGIPMAEGIFKNQYVGRSFLLRSDKRQKLLNDKFRMNREELEGRSVILVDDSVIKGKTMSTIIERIKAAGATEVTVLSSAPPYINACLMGMDTHDVSLLVARHKDGHDKEPQEIAREIGAKQVVFNTVERVLQAIEVSANTPTVGSALGSFCTACATGEYPFRVNRTVDIATPVVRSRALAMADARA